MASDPFLVPITAIRHQPGVRVQEHRQGRLGELAVTASRVQERAETEVEVVLEVVDGGIVAEGQVRAPWQGECCRCLEPVTGELAVEVRELFRPRRRGEAPGSDEETYPLGADLLDLRPLARDALLLGLPLAPRCRPDCAGLCARCGANLNLRRCGCPPEEGDPRWAALDVLR